jgi:hypothetical protein
MLPHDPGCNPMHSLYPKGQTVFRKVKHFYYSYAINELPTDLWAAFRSKQMIAWAKNGFNCTQPMADYNLPALRKKYPHLFT